MAMKCTVCKDTGCCPVCEGRGAMADASGASRLPCSTCFGSGDCYGCVEKCETDNDYEKSGTSHC